MTYMCKVCEEIHQRGVDALQCFYSHEDYMDHLLPEENYVERVCERVIHKMSVEDILDTALKNALDLANILTVLKADGNLERAEVLENLAMSILSITQLSYMYSDPDEMNEIIEDKAEEIDESLDYGSCSWGSSPS
jgi:hypothetical protein